MPTPFKTVNNSDAGTAAKHGGNDLDRIASALNGNDVDGPIIFKTDLNTLKHGTTNVQGDILKHTGTKYDRFAKGAANQVLRVNAAGTDLEWAGISGTGDITSGANVGSGTGSVFRDKTGGNTLNFKTLLAGSNITLTNNANDVTIASTAGGGTITGGANVGTGAGLVWKNQSGGVINFRTIKAGSNITVTNNTDDVTIAATGGGGSTTVQAQNYLVYIDPSDGSYKARNLETGAVDFTHATDATAVLSDIFTSVSSSVPLVIEMGKGSFNLRSWNEADFRTHLGNFAIIGQGRDITKFIVTDDVEDIAGDNRVMAFEQSQSGGTSTTLTANCTEGSASISVTSATGFAVGDDIILCSDQDWDTAFAGDDRTQMNQIVSISGTTFMLRDFAAETFNTANNARIIKKAVLHNIYLANFSIEAAATYTNTTTFFRFDYCDNVLAENICLRGVKGDFHTALVTSMVTNSLFRNFLMDLPSTMGHFTTAGPYGISCRAACHNVVYENFVFTGGWRHAFTTTGDQAGDKDGVPKKIAVINPRINTCSEAALDTHGQGESLYFINPMISGYRSADSTDTVAGTSDTDAINTRCKEVHIVNPMIFNCRGNGINITTQGYGITIQGGYIRNIRNGMKAINISSGHDIQISDINIDTVDKEAIYINDSVSSVQVSGVHISNVCTADNTLSPITGDPSSTDVNLTNIMIDTSNDANIVPIKLDSTTARYTMSNITLVGAGKDCTLSGFDHNLDTLTCRGRNLQKPLKKFGRWEAGVPGSTTQGVLNGNVTASGGTRRIEPTDGLFQEFATSTLNATQGLRGTNNYFERDLNPYIRFVFRLETTSLCRFFLLFSNLTSLPSGADPLVSLTGVGLKLDSGGSNFQVYSNSGDATTTTGANIAAVDTNRHNFEIRGDAANNKYQYRWDFGTWTDITTDIPSGSSEMTFHAYVENNETGVEKRFNLLEVETWIDNK